MGLNTRGPSASDLLVDDLGGRGDGGKVLLTAPVPASSGSVVSVASNASAVILRNANQNRRKAIIKNASTAVLYVSLGSTVPTSALYTVDIPAGGTYETAFQGTIRGIWSAVNGQANVTELTA